MTALILGSALMVQAPVHAQPVEQSVESFRDDDSLARTPEGFVHRASGYMFPLVLGELPARKTYVYSADDVSLYYTLKGGGNGDAWLSLYVYASTLSLDEQVEDVAEALSSRMPGVRLSEIPGLPPAPQGAREQWFAATVDNEAVITGFRIVSEGPWTIKVRLTIPKSGGQEALERGWKALDSVPWTMVRERNEPALSLVPVNPPARSRLAKPR